MRRPKTKADVPVSAIATAEVSEAVDWRLLECVFDQRAILLIGGLLPAIVAAFSFVRNSDPWYVWWGTSAIAVLLFRYILNEAFARRTPAAGRPTLWRRGFLIGTWLNGAIYGIGAAASVLRSDAFTQMLAITLMTAFVMGSAARNGVYPKAAIGSILLAEIPLMLACVAMRDIYYILYGGIALLFTASATNVARHLYTQTVCFLTTDEEKIALFNAVSRSNDELAAANAKLAAMADTDGLTGVPNRRRFDTTFVAEQRSVRRDDSDLSVLMFDIDSFKGYNDRYGHQGGDECLRQVARALASSLRRPRDLLARYGGEEFVAVLPATGLDEAAALAESLRETVESLGLENAGSTHAVVTVSIGVATAAGSDEASVASLVQRADEALYAAKHAGRNCVGCAPAQRLRLPALAAAPARV